MLEVSRAESDDEAELSLELELSIGGSYGKCEKQRAAEQVEEEISGAADPCRRREIQAMRRLEARRKREEKMRRLEEQQFEERARCRKMREDEGFLEDKSCRRKESAAKITHSVNNGKNVFLASFRPYVLNNGGVDNNVAQNSGCGFVGSGNRGLINVVGGNGSIEMSSSAISDYRSTSGKGGSTSDTGSHSSCMQATERQKSVATNNNTWNQARPTMHVPKNMIILKESHCGIDTMPASSKPDPRADASTSKPENPVPSPLKQQSMDKPPNASGMPLPPAVTQMPCVTTTGNGSKGKTITGFLYRYTNAADVRIICVCHGSSFSPAEFVEHAGGTDIINPLRHITVIPAALG